LVENPPRDARKEIPDYFLKPNGPADAAPATENMGKKSWKDLFSSPELQGLIQLALKNNQELNVRMQEVIIAQTEVAARRGEFWPKVNAGVGAGLEKVGDYTSQGFADKLTGVPQNLGNFAFGLTASWEVDIWGKLRSAAKAANFRYLAGIEGQRFMTTQLVSEIARSYYELIALDNQLDVLNRNIKLQQDALEVVRIEKTAAKVTLLAVKRFEAEVLKNRSRLYDLEQERVQTENRINFLVGRFPQPVARNPAELQTPLPATIRSGIPSQMLENRTDVQQAELALEAAKLDVHVARTKFYPALSIDAGVGYQTFNIAHIVSTPESLIYNIAGNLTAPLLNRSGIEADYRAANARQLQSVFNYEKTLLQAFTDVVNQLVKFQNLQKSYDLQQQQVDTLSQSVEISNVLFQSARADYMEVLLTRRDSLDAQMELIETRKRLLVGMVNIYQSLGGGWQADANADSEKKVSVTASAH
jgi:NodT family efflux transporter outer membrane factor (OMF) lipoprotein